MSSVDQAEALIHKGGHVHLMGIGGIGMAGVAWLLKERGFKVSGCDLQQNRQTEWLARHGVEIDFGHDEGHVEMGVDWLIRSTAVPDSHPEVKRALESGVFVSRRGEVLPALTRDRVCIAVSGTHGKTTTTAMLAAMLKCGFCVGGEVAGFEGVSCDGDVMVVEADESDGTVAGYTPDYAIITNIEYDHMEHHDSEAAFVGCFEKLIAQTKKTVYYRADDPISMRLCAGNPKCVAFHFPESPLPIPLLGKYNQWNAAAAVAISAQWKTDEEIARALANIRPVARRFETVHDDGGIRIISDYAHHPTETAALIQAAAELNPRRLLGIFQPHRYTRTLALGPDFPASFAGLEKLWLVPVYAASERPLEGGTSADLAARFPAEWEARLSLCDSLESAWSEVASELCAGDLLLIIGAGDIEKVSEWARGWRPGG